MLTPFDTRSQSSVKTHQSIIRTKPHEHRGKRAFSPPENSLNKQAYVGGCGCDIQRGRNRGLTDGGVVLRHPAEKRACVRNSFDLSVLPTSEVGEPSIGMLKKNRYH